MDMEDVGNNGPVSNVGTGGNTFGGTGASSAEMAELDREFAEIAEEFGLDETVGGGEFDALDAALEDAGLTIDATESMDPRATVLAIADGWQPDGMGESSAEWGPIRDFFRNKIKKKAKELIRKVSIIIRKSPKYASCLPALMKAIVAFKAGKWGTALKAVYATYRCVKSK